MLDAPACRPLRFRRTNDASGLAMVIDVVCLTPFFPPMVSGAADYLGDVAAGLTTDGHRVQVVTSQGTGGVTTRDGVLVRSVRARGRGFSSVRMVVAAVAAHRRSRFDVVVAGAAYPNGVVAALVASLIRRPLVVIAYGEDVSVARRSRFALLCLSRVWRTAHTVIAISSFTRDEILAQGALAATCHVVPPGIGPGPFDATGSAQRRAFRERHHLTGPVLLTVARLEERKGHDVVIGAIAELADLHALEYVVVGSGDQTTLRALARRYGIEQRLTILEHLDQQQLAEAYAGADVYVMMSRTATDGEVEGFGIVYLEAAASGLPCIAGDQGGAPDAVLHGVTGFCVDPEDIAAVARAVRLLVDRPDLAHTMGIAGRERVHAEFTRDQMQAQTTAHIVAAGTDRRRRRPTTPS
jgi:phosphatidylinositol alpha-1,6-mannosyltransferase